MKALFIYFLHSCNARKLKNKNAEDFSKNVNRAFTNILNKAHNFIFLIPCLFKELFLFPLQKWR